ncbi:MAG: outer membrane beta-barrel protein [Granulosicoccus sp.]|nr:outer membrane beta-barrel protein [Granulosicoccus sp.]
MASITRVGPGGAVLIAILAAFLFASKGVQAGGYVGLDGTSLDVENAADSELNPRGLRLRLGIPVGGMFDVEFHLGGGSDRDNVIADKFSTTYAGAFLKGYVPVGSRSALFVLGGFSAVDLSQSIDGREFSDGRSSVSWGFGLETELSERLDLSADYVLYLSDDGPFSAVSAVNLGFKLYF